MKSKLMIVSALGVLGLLSCQKNNDGASSVTLTPSTTTAQVGQTVTVAVNSSANASSWTVTPATSVTKTYGITTSKINSFTFNQAGVYRVAVTTKNISCDSISGAAVNAAWNSAQAQAQGGRGNCDHGTDSASVAITVTDK